MATMQYIDSLTVTDWDDIELYTKGGSKLITVLDELKSFTLSHSQDNTAVTGAKGKTIGMLKANKSAKMSGENGMISLGLMASQYGTEVEYKDTIVRYSDYVKVNSNEATISYSAVGTTGAEIVEVLVRADNGAISERYYQGASATETTFTYAPDTKKITFGTEAIADGTEVIVKYDRKVSGAIISDVSDKYSDTVTAYINGRCEDKCHNVYRFQIYVPFLDFNGTFDLTGGNDQTTISFEGTELSYGCGNINNLYHTVTIFGLNAEDV